MKRAVITMLAIFAISTLSAQQIVEKTLVKPVNLYGNMVVDASLDGQMDVKEWSSEHAKIEINIKAYGINSQVLKSLVAAGRYNVKIDKQSDKIVLSSPNLAKELKVRGNMLKDEVIFTIYVPTSCKVNTTDVEGVTSIN